MKAKLEVGDYPVNNFMVFDGRDDGHLASTGGAKQRGHFKSLFNKLDPHLREDDKGWPHDFAACHNIRMTSVSQSQVSKKVMSHTFGPKKWLLRRKIDQKKDVSLFKYAN